MFNIKIYDKTYSWTPQTLEIEKLESVSTFAAQINGGFWSVNVWIAYKITNTSITISDIVEIQYKNDVIFIGSVLNVKKTYAANKELISLNLVGLGSLPSLLLTNATYSDTASNIIKDLIDDYNVEYWTSILSYDVSSIPSTVDTLDLDFTKYVSYLKAMEEVAETSGLYFFIDLDGKVYMKEKSAFTEHTLTLGLDVDEVIIDEDSKELVNSLILKYNGWTKTYSDATSQSNYGKREKYLDKSSDLSNLATADIYGANYITKYKDEVKKISLKVNIEYNFFSIKAGDLINIRNTDYVLNTLQVAKITYWLEQATLELEKSYSFAKEIFNS